MAEDEVVLVDVYDIETGTMGKTKAHREGELHRAFSVFVFNSKGEILLQQRASGKYHSGGDWSNTCCSHPRPGESLESAVKRRMQEEMGFFCPVRKILTTIYKLDMENGMIEHELNHVFIGEWDGAPEINESEVQDWKFDDTRRVEEEVRMHKGNYSAWFRELLPLVISIGKPVDL